MKYHIVSLEASGQHETKMYRFNQCERDLRKGWKETTCSGKGDPWMWEQQEESKTRWIACSWTWSVFPFGQHKMHVLFRRLASCCQLFTALWNKFCPFLVRWQATSPSKPEDIRSSLRQSGTVYFHCLFIFFHLKACKTVTDWLIDLFVEPALACNNSRQIKSFDRGRFIDIRYLMFFLCIACCISMFLCCSRHCRHGGTHSHALWCKQMGWRWGKQIYSFKDSFDMLIMDMLYNMLEGLDDAWAAMEPTSKPTILATKVPRFQGDPASDQTLGLQWLAGRFSCWASE